LGPKKPSAVFVISGFELAVKDNGGVGEFFFWQAELGAKEDLGRPELGQSHQAQQPWRKDTGVKTHEGPKADPRINKETFIRQSCHAKANVKIPAFPCRRQRPYYDDNANLSSGSKFRFFLPGLY
jgi:hypothetical protein